MVPDYLLLLDHVQSTRFRPSRSTSSRLNEAKNVCSLRKHSVRGMSHASRRAVRGNLADHSVESGEPELMLLCKIVMRGR